MRNKFYTTKFVDFLRISIYNLILINLVDIRCVCHREVFMIFLLPILVWSACEKKREWNELKKGGGEMR